MPSCACFCTQPVPLLEGKQFVFLSSIAAYNRAWGAGALIENTCFLIAFSLPRQPARPSVFTSKLAFHPNQLARNRARGTGQQEGPIRQAWAYPHLVLPSKRACDQSTHSHFQRRIPIHSSPTHSNQPHPTLSLLKPLPTLAHVCLYHPWF